jgi:hypothetical protein
MADHGDSAFRAPYPTVTTEHRKLNMRFEISRNQAVRRLFVSSPAAFAALAIAACGSGDGDRAGGSPVSRDRFEEIPRGAAKGEVRYDLGTPAAVREEDGASCLEYRESEGDGIGRPGMFRFCFRDGVLVAKEAY